MLESDAFIEATGPYLANQGATKVRAYVSDLVNRKGGVFFVDEAHQLVSSTHNGMAVLDYLLDEVESKRGQVIFILAGNEKGMRKLLGHGDKGVQSLLPHTVLCPDYSDSELLDILGLCIEKEFKGEMDVEGGMKGKYMRIATKRVGKNRGTSQFTNARAVENLCAQIWERQSVRLARSIEQTAGLKPAEDTQYITAALDAGDGTTRTTEPQALKSGMVIPETSEAELANRSKETTVDPINTEKPRPPTAEGPSEDDTATQDSQIKDGEWNEELELNKSNILNAAYHLFTKEDVLGPDPSSSVLESAGWKKLQQMTGLKDVKQSIGKVLRIVKSNCERELEEKPLHKLSLNRLLLGPPGTGKTLVAKLYGQILTEIGALSQGEVVIRTPAEIIGRYLGDTEANMKSLLSAAIGNVLIIDEAHTLFSGGLDDVGGNDTSEYYQAIVNTLVGDIQEGCPDRCILLVGSGEGMEEMLRNSDPGLARRFPLADAFRFQNYELPELETILRSKLQDHGLWATELAIKVAMDVVEKASTRLNFGNGGELENVIARAKANYQNRIPPSDSSAGPIKWIFLPQDFDPEFERGKSAENNLKKIFHDVIGFEGIIDQLDQYQRVSQAMKLKGIDPKDFVPTNFIFKGPPGTGKTTTARKIAQVYYDMGFLSEATVIECSVTDLTGKYIGHSGPKTRKMFERALGRVLFIDEAYRLAPKDDHGGYSTEVVSELVDLMTKPQFRGKLIIILAGYEAEMNYFLNINPGLASRFPEEVNFPALGPDHSLQILRLKLAASGISIPILDQPKVMACKNLGRLMGVLARSPAWGNARDVETLAKTVTRSVFSKIKKADDELVCSTEMVTNAMEYMLHERQARVVRDLADPVKRHGSTAT